MATRYLTRRYVAIDDLDDAKRLADIDETPYSEIEITEGVDLLHNGREHWQWWSDRFTYACPGRSMPKRRGMSDAADRLIDTIKGSDSGFGVHPTELVKIDTVHETTVDTGADRGHYARRRLLRLDCTMTDGSSSTLWVETVGYCEGYEYSVTREDPRIAAREKQRIEHARGCSHCEPRPERTAQIWQPCDYCGHEPIYIDAVGELERFL